MRKPIGIFLLLFWLLAGCGGAPVPEATPTAPVVTDLQVLVAGEDFAAGQPRVPFVFFDGPNRTANVSAVDITVFDLSEEPAVAGWSGPAESFNDYEVPYWTVHPEIPHAGIWGLIARTRFPDGSSNDIQFAIEVKEAYSYPTIGDAAIPVDNPTLPEAELAAISTDPEPEPALYETTITAALASGKPTVIMFATPAYCQTAVCAPAVETMKAVYGEYEETVNFVQIEIYADYQAELLAEAVAAWRLVTEPWTYVIDGDGIITARMGGPVSPRELTEALEEILP